MPGYEVEATRRAPRGWLLVSGVSMSINAGWASKLGHPEPCRLTSPPPVATEQGGCPPGEPSTPAGVGDWAVQLTSSAIWRGCLNVVKADGLEEDSTCRL